MIKVKKLRLEFWSSKVLEHLHIRETELLHIREFDGGWKERLSVVFSAL